MLCSHETPMATGRSLDLVKLLASAEGLSREEFPGALKGLGLEGKPNAVKPEAGLPCGSGGPTRHPGIPGGAPGRARSAPGDPSRRRVAGAAGGPGGATPCSASSASTSGTPRTRLQGPRAALRATPARPGSGRVVRVLATRVRPGVVGRHGDALADLASARAKAQGQGSSVEPDWLEVVDAYARCDSARLARKRVPMRSSRPCCA